MVRRPLERSSAEASSAGFNMGRQAHTPQTDSDPSISRQFTPSSTSNASQSAGVLGTLDPDPDIPLPSIERVPGQASFLTTDNKSTMRARTPSVSISPPVSEENGSPTPSFSTTYGASRTPGSTIPSLNERIENLGLSREPAMPGASSRRSIPSPHRSGSDHSSHSLITATDDGRSTQSSRANGIANIIEAPEASQPNSPSPGIHLSPRSPSADTLNRDAASRPGSASRRRSSSHHDQTPHNVADEEPPHERFHEPDFQRAFTNARGLVADLVNVLASSLLHNEPDSRIRALYLQAGDLAHFQNPSTHTVGLVGDSGVGKSSLLNSLLDFEGFARTSNSGAACTCVVTEYHYHEHPGFAIEMEYFALDELRDQLTELLQSYRQYHLRHLRAEGMSEDERKDLEKKAKVAQDTFRAAFRNHLAQNERFLLDRTEESVLQTLLTWARSSGLPLTEGADRDPRREVFADASQCSNHLMELTSEQNSPNGLSAWPFIRKIKVYLNAYILSKGLILVDLPGLRDLNSARLKITERYMLHCDEIFAVCCIGRATTDAGVMAVFELARRASLSKIGIICTKSDDIVAEEAQHDWDGVARTTIRNMTRNIETAQETLDTTEGRIRDLSVDSDGDDEMNHEESQELLRLHAASRRIKKRINGYKFELKSYLITTRNQRVTDSLQATYRDQIRGSDLRVFCVSNVEYWEHRATPKVEALPFLRLSGIIEVRKYCLSIVAESQLHAATEYMTDAIPALLGSLELWIQSGSGSVSAERKQAIRNTLGAIEGALDVLKLPASPINTTERSMERRFNEQVSHTMRQYSDQWSHAARNATVEWQGWHHSTYSAFCRNYGDHYTAAVGSHCWNDEAMHAMVTQMAGPWQIFQQNLQNLQDDLSVAIENGFDRAIALSDPTGVATGSLRTLTITLGHRQALLLSSVEKLCDDFESDIFVLRTDAFSGIRSSFMGQLMEPSYNTCRLESGGGSDMRRKNAIRNGFGNEQLFENLRRKFARRFSELAGCLGTNIREAIATHLAVVQHDLDTLRNENVALESESDPEFRRRLEEAVHGVREDMEDIYRVVRPSRQAAA